jgi:hypothetical protein
MLYKVEVNVSKETKIVGLNAVPVAQFKPASLGQLETRDSGSHARQRYSTSYVKQHLMNAVADGDNYTNPGFFEPREVTSLNVMYQCNGTPNERRYRWKSH